MKKVLGTILLTSLAAANVSAQRYKFELNAETPEGQLLQKAGQESDDDKRIALYEEFLKAHPSHAGAGYAWATVQPLYLKSGQLDKALEAADKGLSIDPFNAALGHGGLKAAEQKKDLAAIKTWSGRTAEAAKKILELKAPEDDEEAETHKREVDYAKQVMAYTEYAVYIVALQAQDPATIIDFTETLQQRNPSSEYLPQLNGRYFLALRQTGQADKALAVAEKILDKDQSNEDMLLVAAESYMDGAKKNPDKVLLYAGKIVQMLPSKPAPQGIAEADWQKKRDTTLGVAHWMIGMTHGTQNKWIQTDQAMRAALPLIAGNQQLLGPAYFYLGLANYRLAEGPKGDKKRLPDARKYTQLCTQINGPYQAPAIKNLNAMNAGK